MRASDPANSRKTETADSWPVCPFRKLEAAWISWWNTHTVILLWGVCVCVHMWISWTFLYVTKVVFFLVTWKVSVYYCLFVLKPWKQTITGLLDTDENIWMYRCAQSQRVCSVCILIWLSSDSGKKGWTFLGHDVTCSRWQRSELMRLWSESSHKESKQTHCDHRPYAACCTACVVQTCVALPTLPMMMAGMLEACM